MSNKIIRKIKYLQNQLEKAVALEDYENAAELRDQLTHVTSLVNKIPPNTTPNENEEISDGPQLKSSNELEISSSKEPKSVSSSKDVSSADEIEINDNKLIEDRKIEFKRIELELKALELELVKRKQDEAIKAANLKAAKKQKRQVKRSKIWQWLTKKDDQNMTPLLWIATILILLALSLWVLSKSGDREVKEQEAQEISVELEKKHAMIENYILLGEIDNALALLPQIVHPSKERSPYKPDGVFSDHYTYNEYWQIKREELRLKIESAPNSKNQPDPVKNEKKV
jgi:hypothetical protein